MGFITAPTTGASSKGTTKVPDPMSFDGFLDAHNFLKAGGYVYQYQSPDIWKKGGVIARGRRVSSTSYVVTFHEL